MARVPAALRADIDVITPALRPWYRSQAKPPHVACQQSPYGCEIDGANIYFKARQVAAGVCQRTRVSAPFNALERFARYQHLPLDRWMKVSGQTQLRAGGHPCDQWPADIKGTRSPVGNQNNTAKVLGWLYTQQGLIRAGRPSVLRVTCATGWKDCPEDPRTWFAAAELADIPHITQAGNALDKQPPERSEVWVFSLKAVPSLSALQYWPAYLRLPPDGDPELHFWGQYAAPC